MDAFMQYSHMQRAGVSESERALLDLKFRAKRYTCSMSVTCRGSYSTTLQTSDLDAPRPPRTPPRGEPSRGYTKVKKQFFEMSAHKISLQIFICLLHFCALFGQCAG